MSEELGASLPPPLRFEFGAHPSGDGAKAILLVTTDADGSHRVAVLAASEVSVPDASRVAFRLHATSTSCNNVRRSGQAALWCVLDAAAYCIRGNIEHADNTPDADYQGFVMTICSVLRDFEPTAPMISGPTYRRLG